jgi:hypothetical protein
VHHGAPHDGKGKARLHQEAPNEMSKKVPEFHSEAAEATFWDKHDATEFLDDLAEDCDTVFVRPEAGVIELSKETWQELARVARRRRTTPTRLLHRWLKEKLTQGRSEKQRRLGR